MFFLTLGVSCRGLLLLYSRGFLQDECRFGIHPFGINDEPKTVSKGITNEIEGILRILPRAYGALLRVVSNAQRGIGFWRHARRRSVLRRNGLHHIFGGKPFGGTLIIPDRDLIQLSVEEGEKNLLHAI